jgi:hypothetical protein
VRRGRHVAWLCALAGALGAAPSALSAQASDSLFATGVRAYKNLEFDLAAWALRRDLARLTAAGAPPAARAQGLVYLGAAEVFRGRRDSAAAVFRRLVTLDPRYRPDRLVFPPEVTSLFDGVRLELKTVTVEVPRDTTITPGPGAFGIWIFASSFQTVDVTLRYEDGAPFRSLYFGPIGDSLNVQWDGLDAAGGLPPVNRVLLRVASRAPSGALAGIVQLPLDLRLFRPDTLPWPPPPADSQFLPERATSSAARRALLGGVVLSGAVAALPALVGGTDTPSGPRIAVAGSIGVAGLLGYVLHRPGRPLAANVRANQTLRDAWQRRVETARAENARRRRDVRVVVRAGEPSAIQPRGP